MKKLKLKSILLSLMMAAGTVLPSVAVAQSDGFFRGGNDYIYRDGGFVLGDMNNLTPSSGDMSLGGMTQEDPTPLGSGLLILTAIGAGYATLKRKQH